MSKHEKLVERFLSYPSDFTFDEARTLIEGYGYSVSNKGRTSGSRVEFTRGRSKIALHKPHPHKILQKYQIKVVKDELKKEELI